jgi:protein-L-isoaspartate(D-aspartate) O-methyltransferase
VSFDLAEHQKRFIDGIDRSLRADVRRQGLSLALREALFMCPRHLFLRRFRFMSQDVVRDVSTEHGLASQAPFIYSNAVLRHVGAEGNDLPSSNSQPWLVAYMLDLLDLRAGHRVLEIGSGGGWLAGLAGRLVGPNGHVTGVEIIEELAQQSRDSLAAAGIQNVSITAGDGALGFPPSAPFDRVIFTVGTWDLPAAFFDQVRDNGLLLVPLQIKGWGNDLVLLRKIGDQFRSEAVYFTYFVALTGSKASGGNQLLRLEDLPFWPEIREHECVHQLAWFGGSGADTFRFRTSAFRSLLTKVEPGLRMIASETGAFALVDAKARSVAVCEPRTIVGYGDPAAADALFRAYRWWTDLFMPAVDAFDLSIYPAVLAPETTSQGQWIEKRGDAVLVWSLKKGLASLSLASRLARSTPSRSGGLP